MRPWQEARVGVQDDVVRRRAEGAQHPGLLVARVGEQAKRLVAVRRDDDGVEPPRHVVVRPQLDAVRHAVDRADAEPEVHAAREPFEQRADVGLGPARHRPPAVAAEPEHPVVLEEADRVRRRELERPLGGGRPQRRGERDEVVRAEPPRVAAAPSRTRRASAPRSPPRRATAAPSAATGRPRRGARGTAGRPLRRGWANGRLPDHSRPHAPQLTENDISAACTPTPSSRNSRVSSG